MADPVALHAMGIRDVAAMLPASMSNGTGSGSLELADSGMGVSALLSRRRSGTPAILECQFLTRVGLPLGADARPQMSSAISITELSA